MSWIDLPPLDRPAAPDPAHDAGHVCLAGSRLSADWALIAALKRRHQVTVAESVAMLEDNPLLACVDVLALDCSGEKDLGETVRRLRLGRADLCVVLVGEAAAQEEIAEAFRQGAQDYFADSSDSDLLAERVHSLSRRYRRRVVQFRPRDPEAVS